MLLSTRIWWDFQVQFEAFIYRLILSDSITGCLCVYKQNHLSMITQYKLSGTRRPPWGKHGRYFYRAFNLILIGMNGPWWRFTSTGPYESSLHHIYVKFMAGWMDRSQKTDYRQSLGAWNIIPIYTYTISKSWSDSLVTKRHRQYGHSNAWQGVTQSWCLSRLLLY